MGRFYSGNINGKFWVAVQSTYCMEEYGATFDGFEYRFVFCGCCADGKDDGTDFCQYCFDSREEHLKAIEDDGEEDVTITTQEGDEANFSMTREAFFEQGKPFIEKHAELFMKCVKEFKIDEEDNDYEYECEMVSVVPSEEISTIADLCMLKQIENFFEDIPDEDECSWCGEC